MFGDFDPRVDHIRATNGHDHYEQVWVTELKGQVKVPPRSLFIIDKIVNEPNNQLRNRNDYIRDAIVRGYHWRHQQAKDINLVLASELEREMRHEKLQTKLEYALRQKNDEDNLRVEILSLLSGPYNLAMEILAEEAIASLETADYIIECTRKLEDFRRRK